MTAKAIRLKHAIPLIALTLFPLLSAIPSKAEDEKKPVRSWDYSHSDDRMRGTSSREASLNSEEATFTKDKYGNMGNWPELSLTLRSKEKGGTEVLIEVPSGMLICDEYEHPSISVKFDSKPVMKFSCTAAADAVFTGIFISDAPRFLKLLRTAQTVIIEPNFYQRGPRQFTFRPDGLVWK